jgi:hypothetical protein
MGQPTIDGAGEKIICNNLEPVYVYGAYGLGPVYETRPAEAAIHAGECIQHASGAGGEDGWVLSTDESYLAYGLAEIDFGQMASCATDFASGDQLPGIAFHLHPGAYCRNIQAADPAANIEPDTLFTTSSGTAGSLKNLVEVALVDPAGAGTGEAFNSGVTWGDMGSLHHPRLHVRNAYYIANPAAAHTFVGYLLCM